MVENTQVAELMDDDVVEHLEGREHESPVEGERAARGAGAPERSLAADPDAPVRDPEPLGLLLGEGRNELPGADAAADSLTASSSSPSRGTWSRRCSSIQVR